MRTPCRFGDFVFDPASGELRGPAGVVRLQPQIAALLETLIERAGSVVSRAELQARLWPDTNVEFDEGINNCVRQLRVALGDSATEPRYIETLPRRGYRFIPQMEPAVSAVRAGEQPAATHDSPPGGSASMRRGRRLMVIAAIAALAVGALLWRGWRGSTTSSSPRPVVLVVLPFTADTSDSVVVAYRQRLFRQIVADARAERAFSTTTTPSPAATHVLEGVLTRRGNSVRIFVQLVRADDRRVHLWADDIVDAYAFAGNSTVTADRIERSAARLLGGGPPAQR